MPDSDDHQWVKTTANELNNLLQVISESSQKLETVCEGTSDTDRYFAMMRSAIDRAAKVTHGLIERAGGASAPDDKKKPTAIPEAEPETKEVSGKSDIKIFNPQGPLELVMLVDDEEFITMLAEQVLADEGYRVITARDGFQAVEIYRRLKDEISLVLLDFTMPVMDGADVFEELLQINPRVPVVLSSGFTEHIRLRGMLAKGLRGFIPKPYAQQKLLTEVRATLDTIKEEKSGEKRPV